MSLKLIGPAEHLGGDLFRLTELPYHAHGRCGHAHFWDRAMSRRGLFGKVATLAGVAAGSRLVTPSLLWGQGDATPKPIPGTIKGPGGGLIHFAPPVPGAEPSTITDFQGVVAVADISGTGTGTDSSGNKTSLTFGCDMRFMKGAYIAVDGNLRTGTFSFI